MFRSRRERRIDRALSSVLHGIDDHYDNFSPATWREIDELAIAADRARIGAHKRAEKLFAQWRKRVAADLEA
jgi:hypothetical protein